MFHEIKIVSIVAGLAFSFGFPASVYAKPPVTAVTTAKTLYTGIFHGKVHNTSGRATIYQESDGRLILRLTNFKTSNGPDVHVVLIAVKDASDDADFLILAEYLIRVVGVRAQVLAGGRPGRAGTKHIDQDVAVTRGDRRRIVRGKGQPAVEI